MKTGAEELSYLLKEFPDIEVVATASNGLEAVKLIEDLEPDSSSWMFRCQDSTASGSSANLRENNMPSAVFLLATAYDQYAIEAFRWEALDYL